MMGLSMGTCKCWRTMMSSSVFVAVVGKLYTSVAPWPRLSFSRLMRGRPVFSFSFYFDINRQLVS